MEECIGWLLKLLQKYMLSSTSVISGPVCLHQQVSDDGTTLHLNNWLCMTSQNTAGVKMCKGSIKATTSCEFIVVVFFFIKVLFAVQVRSLFWCDCGKLLQDHRGSQRGSLVPEVSWPWMQELQILKYAVTLRTQPWGRTTQCIL